MHEYSVVSALIDLCEENAKKNNCTKITKAIIKIGVASGVEPQLLQIAFDTFKLGSLCDDCKLEIVLQELVAKCEECAEVSEIKLFENICPKCKSTKMKTIDGEDAYLMSLEME